MDVPAELDQIVMRLLARDPDDRYPSCRELLRDLEALRAATPSEVQQARKRHGQLIDKKFAASLSGDEERELSELEQLLDRADASMYEPIKQRLQAEVERLSAQRSGDDRR